MDLTSLKKLQPLAWPFFLALMVVTFLPALTGRYLSWDDNLLIVENQILEMSFREALASVFTTYFNGDSIPLTIMSFWTEVSLFGFSSTGQHVTNLLVHLCNVALLGRILFELKVETKLRWLVLLTFALHPLQVESVAWISERKGLGATFFALAATLTFIKFRQNQSWVAYAISIALFALALGFKASIIPLPFLLMMIDVFFFETKWRASLLAQLPLILGALAFAALRYFAYGHGVTNLSSVTFDPDRLMSLPLTVLHALGFYLSKFFVPVNLSPTYQSAQLNLEGWALIALALIFLFGALGWGWFKRQNLVLVGLGLFLLFLLPVLHVVPRINHVNDRYMYVPVIGIALVVGALSRRARTALIVLSLLSWPVLSYHQTYVWRDSKSLWSRVLQIQPKNMIALNNYALELQKQGDLVAARAIFEEALKIESNAGERILILNNLGILLLDPATMNPDLRRASTYFEEAIQISPSRADAYESRFNLSLALLKMGEKDRSLAELKGLDLDLSQADARYFKLKLTVRNQIQFLSVSQ